MGARIRRTGEGQATTTFYVMPSTEMILTGAALAAKLRECGVIGKGHKAMGSSEKIKGAVDVVFGCDRSGRYHGWVMQSRCTLIWLRHGPSLGHGCDHAKGDPVRCKLSEDRRGQLETIWGSK